MAQERGAQDTSRGAKPKAELGDAIAVRRVFSQPADAISLYSDFTQVIGASGGEEVCLQFYETIYGPPAQTGGPPQEAQSRLRCTVFLSWRHAKRIADLLQQHAAPQERSGTDSSHG